MNLKTDLSWVKRITGSHPDNTTAFVKQVTIDNCIPYDQAMLTAKFNMSQFFEKSFYPVSFYYLGMLTKQDQFNLTLPNLNMRKIFVVIEFKYYSNTKFTERKTSLDEFQPCYSAMLASVPIILFPLLISDSATESLILREIQQGLQHLQWGRSMS